MEEIYDADYNPHNLVCVLCGEPWVPVFKNRCECGGFCTWGKEKSGPPSSWNVDEQGRWSPKPAPENNEMID